MRTFELKVPVDLNNRPIWAQGEWVGSTPHYRTDAPGGVVEVTFHRPGKYLEREPLRATAQMFCWVDAQKSEGGGFRVDGGHGRYIHTRIGGTHGGKLWALLNMEELASLFHSACRAADRNPAHLPPDERRAALQKEVEELEEEVLDTQDSLCIARREIAMLKNTLADMLTSSSSD